MNKIFKVVWSKTKECYVVVSEVAKNNGGKKKVLASVLAGLAMVGAGAQVQAYSGLGGHDDPSVETLAVGPDTWANQEAAVAVGMHNNANGRPAGKHSVAIGNFSNANGEISIAMGGVTNASGKMSVAVGYQASATDEAAVALGNMVSADKNSTGVGPGAIASGTYAFAGGYQSETTGISGVAIGDNAKAKAARAMAIGGHAEATAEQAIAIGSDTGAGNKTTASKKNAIAVGHGATASGLDTAAIGTSATASGQSSVALGNGTQSTNLNTTAIGSNVQSTKTGSIGIGGNVESIGDYSVAIGSASAGKTVKAVDYATAVGGLSNAAERAAALGAGADAAQARSVAIGYRATASTADGVAIGSTSVASTAAGVQGFNPADSRTNKYGGLTSAAQTSTLAAVSIGNGSAQTRQITGLAAGKEDTDAVNVAQLRSVNLKYAADTGSNDFLLTDGTLTVNGDGDLISTSVEPTGVIKVTAKKGGNITHTDGKAVKPTTNGIATTDNVADAINDSYWKATAGGNTVGTVGVGNVKPGNKVTFSAGDNLKVKQSINTTTGDQEYTYSLNPVLTGITSIANTAGGPTMTFGGNSINITGGSLNMGNSKITNLAPGTDEKDAVNVKQLKDTEIHITPGTYTPDSNKKVTLTYENADNKTVAGKTAVIDLSGLATGGTASTEKVKKAANGANDTNIAEVNPQTGDTYGAADATYEVSVSRNAVKDAAREAVTVNNGGTTTGGTYTADTNNPISVTATPDNNSHNTTYAVTFDGNKAAKQIPLTYKANNAGAKTVTLDKGLDFTNGTNTTAEIGNDGVVKYNLKDNVTLTNAGSLTVGDTKVNNDGVTITAPTGGNTTNVTLTQSGLDNGGNKIVNVKDGDVNATSKDAVNGSQLYAVASKERHIAPTTTGHEYTVDSNGDVTLNYVDGDGNPTSEKAVISGIANKDLSNISTAGETKIKNLAKSAINMEDGKNTKASKRDVNGVDTYKVDVEGDLTGISSITNGGTNNGKISFGSNNTVTVDGDHNITLNASTGKIGGLQNKTFDPTNFTSGQAATEDQLKSVHDTLKANELHIAPTETDRTGEYTAGGVTGNTAAGAANKAYKYDATTKQVVLEYNDGTGANKTGTKAVIDLSNLPTGGDMSSFKVTSSAESATVGTHAGDASQEIKNGKSVDFQAGKNMTVTQTNDNGNGNTTINYALNKDLDVESVHVGKDGKDGKIGIDGKDGVDGLNGTNRVDIHVEKGAKGVDGTDGHDGVNGHNGKDGMTRIVYEDKGGKQEVATLNDGMKYAGDDAQGTDKTKVIAKKLNETLDIIGGANKADLTTDNIGVNNDGNGKLLVQLSKNLKGINTIKNGNTTITLNDTPSTTTPAVTITGGNLSLGDGTTNNKIVNVAPGTDDTDAVNYKQLKDAKTVLADGKNTTKSGTGSATDPYKVNVEGDLTEITSITNKADASGNAGKITFSPNQTVTVSGDHNISLNGKTGDITGLTNTTIPTTAGSDFATKGRAATEEQLKIVNDKFNNKINLGADGNTETNKLALDNATGIKFNIKGDGSGTSGANQYISTTASGSDIKVDLTQDAKDKLNKTYDVKSTDKSVTVSASTTNGVTTFDLRVAPAAGTTSTWDIKSSADTANGGATATGHEVNAKTIENAKTVEMIAGKNLTVKQTSDTNGAKVEFALSDEITVGKDGANGANGVDGKIGVNGKDGASVVINGKDGSIGLTGPRGATGAPGASATLNVKDGVPGVDGAPGTNLTRIVYTDKNNVEHEVATHDDGMKFAGDDGQSNQATNANVIKKHLNNVVDIIGGATKADLTTNNIGVNNDGNGKLLVQLSKNLNGINTVKNGNTTITLNDAPGGATNTPAVTISGGNLSVGGNKVTNVDDGKDNSDAVNVKQLKAAKTEVKAGKNVVVTSETSTTDGHTTYTVNASTPVVYTTPDGTTKLIKQPDGTFKDENGNVYNGPVIASFEDGTGARTGGTMIVNNVGSAINGKTGATYLDKLDAAAGDNNTKNAAVNVTDLKNTKDGLIDKGLKFDANVGGVKTNKLGSTVKVQGAGTSADADYSGANIKTFISQTGDDTTIDVKLDKNLKGINKISNGGSSITLNDTPSATVPAVTITGGNLSMGNGTTNNKIVNLAPGTADTDAVNVKQLKDTELHITPGTYTPDTNKKVTLTYTNGNNQLVTGKEAVIDLSGLSTGGATASTWNVKSSANTTDGGAVGATHDANAQNIANGKTVEFQSGKNLVVNQTNDTTNGNATVEFSLSDKITVGKDGVNGKDGSVGAKGADGSAVVMNGADGSIGLNGTNGANGISIKGKDGANGVGIDGKDGVTRIVYTEKVPDPANPSTTKEVTHEVATMDDGLRFTGNNTSTENKRKLGSLVKVQGEGTKESAAADPATGKKYVVLSDGTTKFESAQDNIAVEADGTDTLTVKLNKNLKGLNSIQLGDNTIKSDGDTIKFDTKNSGTKTVATTDQLWTIQAGGVDVPAKSGKVNLVAGDHITITPDAANGKMTISATGFGSMDGFNVKTSAESATVGTHAGDTTENIKNGKTVDMQAGKNLVVTQSNDGNGNTTVNYALNKDVNLGNDGSLKTGDTTIDNDGFKNGNTTVGGNGMTIKNPTDPAKTVSLTKDGLNNGGNQITNVASGGNVDTNAANIGDIKRLAKDTRIQDGTYTVDNTGTVELTYVDGAGKQVTDAAGNPLKAKITGITTLDSTRVNVAVNETGSGKAVGSTAPVKVTKGTEFVAGNNLIVERTAHTGNDLDNSVVYSLNSNLTGITSISNTATGPKMTFGGNNVNFTGGDVKISNGNLDMNKNKITNVANGTDPHDAVNVSQLKAAKTIVEAADTSVTVTKDAGAGANGEDIYKIKANPAGTVDLTNVNNRVDQLGEEIGRVGAQGAALSALKPIQYDPLEPTQIMAGYGNYRGNSALALGVAHYKNESTLIHGGVSWAGGSSHMIANAGVTWKVGNRDSEAAVADRYRKGPISSAYAMQQEMAAMKAQNAGLKGEVSDLKAENEQMKAQIAAMMAKLGL